MRDRRDDPGRVPGEVQPSRCAALGVARCGRCRRDDTDHLPDDPSWQQHHQRSGRGSHCRSGLAGRGRHRHHHGAVDAHRGGQHRRGPTPRHGPGARGRRTRRPDRGLFVRRTRRRGDRTLHGGLRQGRNRLAPGRTGHRSRCRRGVVLWHVPRCDQDQPGQVLQVHGRLPGDCRRRDPLLWHRRSTDSRMAARPVTEGL